MNTSTAPYNPAVRIDKLNTYTLQEIFDFVVTHLRKQGCPALQLDGLACCYRTNQTSPLRCAIGCLIPDELYQPIFEGQSYPTLCLKAFFPDPSVEIKRLLNELQSIHDTSFLCKEARFSRLAYDYNLNLTPL